MINSSVQGSTNYCIGDSVCKNLEVHIPTKAPNIERRGWWLSFTGGQRKEEKADSVVHPDLGLPAHQTQFSLQDGFLRYEERKDHKYFGK